MTWTEERVERLKQLWNDGWSASQIRDALDCGLSRNAVIGKVHRLKLPGRANPVRNLPQRKPRARSSAQNRFNPRVSAKPRTGEPLAQRAGASAMKPNLKRAVGIFDHKEGQCRWIVVEAVPNIHDLRYCGEKVAPGEESLCRYHKAMSINGYRAHREAA